MRLKYTIALSVIMGALLVDYVRLQVENHRQGRWLDRQLSLEQRRSITIDAALKALDECRKTTDLQVEMTQAAMLARVNMTRDQRRQWERKYGRDNERDKRMAYLQQSIEEEKKSWRSSTMGTIEAPYLSRESTQIEIYERSQ